jgi:quaternary ammonium compound-resistance protein SugE
MSWTILIIAGLFEIGWAIGLKYTEGFTRPLASVLTIAAMIISVYLLSVAVRALPIGTGYAVWTGIGAVGAAALGVVLLGESASVGRLVSIALIVAGFVGLKLAG